MYPEQKKPTKTIGIFVGIIILILALFFVFIKPSILGYGVYQEMQKSNYSLQEYGQNLQEINDELRSTKINLSLHNAFNERLQQQLKEMNKELSTCLAEEKSSQTETELLRKTNNQQDLLFQQQKKDHEQIVAEKEKQKELLLKQKDDELTQSKTTLATNEKKCTDDKTTLDQKIRSLEDNYNLLIQNTAKNICCKQKVDNPKITSYSTLDHKILCLETGNVTLTC